MTEPKLTEFESAWVTRLWADSARLGRLAEVKRDFESILAARLAPVETQLDEARANRDRLAHENAALRREMADLRAERDEYVRLRDEWARACASERRALAARGEDIARVRAALARWHGSDEVGPATILLIAQVEGALAALDRPAPQPDEACPNHCREGVVECWSPGGPCEQPNRPGCETCGTCNHCTPPTTDAEEAHVSEIEDGFGSSWATCGPGCDLQVVRPGKVQCNRRSSACPDLPVPGAANSREHFALHVLTEYGTTTCPVEQVRANVDDGECSACGAHVPGAAGEEER